MYSVASVAVSLILEIQVLPKVSGSTFGNLGRERSKFPLAPPSKKKSASNQSLKTCIPSPPPTNHLALGLWTELSYFLLSRSQVFSSPKMHKYDLCQLPVAIRISISVLKMCKQQSLDYRDYPSPKAFHPKHSGVHLSSPFFIRGSTTNFNYATGNFFFSLFSKEEENGGDLWELQSLRAIVFAYSSSPPKDYYYTSPVWRAAQFMLPGLKWPWCLCQQGRRGNSSPLR